MSRYADLQQKLRAQPRTWLVTGVAGFIGSNLLEKLLLLDQRVVGLDNFSNGFRHNLDGVREAVSSAQWARFTFHEGDTRRIEDCQAACRGVDVVLHQAALGSVPRSIADPLRSHQSNVDGFLNVLLAVRDAKIPRLVFASSSCVYGDHPGLPKIEGAIGQLLSPYAATKRITELYAGVFARTYGLSIFGLRYFNVFGPRQNPNGAYAAVIPRWFTDLIEGRPITINGDGETSRDFSYIDNVVAANLLAAAAPDPREASLLNIACGERTTLNALFAAMRELVGRDFPAAAGVEPLRQPERAGDVRHSLADISAARAAIGYELQTSLRAGLGQTYQWYRRQIAPVAGVAL
ncbi:MAG: NAD-dependent epimerase/dehydratase family protein [Opitutaceae bacterium]|nr:NAD-dependent epimerase/dehydratase family protein [Opitutaceae bacterium]